MKNIKINFIDFWDSFNYKDFTIYKMLCKKYNVIISDEPDYIFFSDHGYDHLNYNCIRIYVTIENMSPNFNQCDYAIGFNYITFEDRYLRVPIYLLFDNYINLFKIAEKKHLNEENYKIKTKFCNMVVSNGLSEKRLSFFKKLCSYKNVDSGGKTLNNVGGPVKSKLEFQKHYKFSFAFENSSSNGYTTEKIIDAFAAGSIPIYWGNKKINEIFNKNAFINYDDFKNENELISYIKKVDSNNELYLNYIKQPMLNDINYKEEEFKKMELFLYSIFNQNYDECIRRCDYNHFVIQEKKYFLLSFKIVKMIKPFLKFKTAIKNKLVK